MVTIPGTFENTGGVIPVKGAAMSIDLLTMQINLWVTHYIAVFCLLSIIAWSVGAYLCINKWRQVVRDCAIYFIMAGVLTLLQWLSPARTDVFFWKPITWFSFAMLMVFELLWIVFLIDNVFRGLQYLSKRLSPKSPSTSLRARTTYSRR
jgi:hypothetical protein